MNILWHSNSAGVGSGYGNQTQLFTRRLKADGHNMVISSFYGRQGAPAFNGDGILELPNGVDGYGNDVIEPHYNFGHFNGGPADCVITLMDPFVLRSDIWSKLEWSAWVPIDSMPAFGANVTALRAAKQLWAMSQHGMKMLTAEGFNPTYVPHGVESDVFKPMDRREARTKLAQYLQTNLDDKDLVVTVAANKGTPSRKNFVSMIESFALSVRGNEALNIAPNPNAVYYIHTEPNGLWQGENIRAIAEAFGVADRVFTPLTYHVICGMLNSTFLNQVYNAGDVFMNLGSEGFGIPTVEAQMAGCPVLVADFAASAELCFAGKKLMGLRDFNPVSQVFWHKPIVPSVAKELEWAYSVKNSELLRKQARDGAMAYDADVVFEKYMKPAVAKIATDIQRRKDGLEIVEIPARKAA